MTHLSLEQTHLQESALAPRGQRGLMAQEQHHLTWFHLGSGHQHNGLCFRLKQKIPEITEINLLLVITVSVSNSLLQAIFQNKKCSRDTNDNSQVTTELWQQSQCRHSAQAKAATATAPRYHWTGNCSQTTPEKPRLLSSCFMQEEIWSLPCFKHQCCLLPALLENMLTGAPAGPPGPAGTAWGTLGNPVGGGGGGLLCKENNKITQPHYWQRSKPSICLTSFPYLCQST